MVDQNQVDKNKTTNTTQQLTITVSKYQSKVLFKEIQMFQVPGLTAYVLNYYIIDSLLLASFLVLPGIFLAGIRVTTSFSRTKYSSWS